MSNLDFEVGLHTLGIQVLELCVDTPEDWFPDEDVECLCCTLLQGSLPEVRHSTVDEDPYRSLGCLRTYVRHYGITLSTEDLT